MRNPLTFLVLLSSLSSTACLLLREGASVSPAGSPANPAEATKGLAQKGQEGALVVPELNQESRGEVVVSINGVPITKDDFYDRLERESGKAVVGKLVKDELFCQFAKSKGTAPTDEEVEERYTKLIKNPITSDNLTRSGMSREAIKRAIKVNLAQIKTVSKGMKATDAELMRYYLKNINRKNLQARFYTPEYIQIQIIVVSGKEKATKAKSRLNNEPFEVVAKEINEDPETKLKSGMVPVFARGRTTVSKNASFEKEIFGLKVGQTFGPNLRMGKYWIIRCIYKWPENIQKYSEVKEDCREGVLSEKGNIERGYLLRFELQDFSKRARIDAFWPKYEAAAIRAAE